jgi:tetratricopeptide (TPR) repeat protein
MGPIEPVAITAATLLATKALEALGGKFGEHTWGGMGRLIALVRRKVTGHQPAETALSEVERHPDDQDRIRALAELLAALAAQDAAFHRELAALVSDARRDPSIGSLATLVYGQAQVGQVLNVGRARDIYVQPPPAPPASVGEVRWPTPGRTVANLPPRNPNFTGRADLLEQLHQRLDPGQPAAVVQVQAQTLHGLGGVGKTQLALECAHRHASDYDLIWWISAEQPAAIPGQLVVLARRLGIPERTDQAEIIQALWDELRQRDRWLLVYDNAEDPQPMRPWLPRGGQGHVLITSRNPSWGGLAATLAVDVLPRTEALAFLARRLGRDDPGFDRLAATLGDLPLALEQAAAYVEETAIPASEYLTMLDTHARDLFALGRPATTEQTIATTWIVSLRRLRQQTPTAEELLVLCAFLGPDDIPRSLPTEHPDVLPERLAATVRAPLAYQQAIGALRRYSLITTSQDGQALSMHRLVQAVTRHRVGGEQERHAWAQRAVELLRRAFPADPDEPSAWPLCSQLLAHVLAATENARVEGVVAGETSASLLTDTGVYLRARAQLDLAQTVLERAVKIREAALGEDHPDVAVTLTYLGTVLRRCGEPARARQVLERALEIREGALGRDHPDVAMTLTHLGTALRDVGDLSGGQAVLERALAIREATLEANHPDVAVTLTYLGTVLRRCGEPARARQVLERALEINKTAYGLQDPRLAVTLAHLGHAFRELGDLTRARAAHESALAIRQSVYHGQHPEVAFAFRDLGRTLRDAEDLAGARSHIERALRIFEVAYGPMHPETATSLDHLAIVLRDQGDLDGARSLHERALTIREVGLGPHHPDTARSRERLAAVVRELANRE